MDSPQSSIDSSFHSSHSATLTAVSYSQQYHTHHSIILTTVSCSPQSRTHRSLKLTTVSYSSQFHTRNMHHTPRSLIKIIVSYSPHSYARHCLIPSRVSPQFHTHCTTIPYWQHITVSNSPQFLSHHILILTKISYVLTTVSYLPHSDTHHSIILYSPPPRTDYSFVLTISHTHHCLILTTDWYSQQCKNHRSPIFIEITLHVLGSWTGNNVIIPVHGEFG